jgi:hypothetical protein
MDFYGRRNDVLFAWHHVPFPAVVTHLAGTTINGVRSAWQAGRAWQMAKGLASGYADLLRYATERRPTSAAVYQLHRRLKRDAPLTLASVAAALPPISLRGIDA